MRKKQSKEKMGEDLEDLEDEMENLEDHATQLEANAASLEAKIAEQTELANGYLGQLQRVQADFENYQKRIEVEKGMIADLANANLLVGLLETLDNFERALESMDNIPGEDAEGLKMVYNGMIEYLQSQELQKIKAHGCQFNPNLHEAIMQEESEEEDGTVLEEFACGYALKGKIIRPSKVKVAKQIASASQKDEENNKEE